MGMPAFVPEYTLDMFDALPEDRSARYELLDGILLVTPAPGAAHAELTTRLVVALSQGIPNAVARVAPPGAVRIAPRMNLVPDILVYPTQRPLRNSWDTVQEWWLAIEIVSRSSRIYDREFKRKAYLAVGVREYWIVDPSTQQIEVWHPGWAEPRIQHDELRWLAPDGRHAVTIDLKDLFSDIPEWLED
jgi:Uma2 family endonuclease